MEVDKDSNHKDGGGVGGEEGENGASAPSPVHKRSLKKKFGIFHLHSNSTPNLKVYLKDGGKLNDKTNGNSSTSSGASPRVIGDNTSSSLSSSSPPTQPSSLSMSSNHLQSSSPSLASSTSSLSTSMNNNNNSSSMNSDIISTPPSSPRVSSSNEDDNVSVGSPGSPGSLGTKTKKKLLSGLRRNKGGSNTNNKLKKEIADLSLKSGLVQQYSTNTSLAFNSYNETYPLSASQSAPSLSPTVSLSSSGSNHPTTSSSSSSSTSSKKSSKKSSSNTSSSSSLKNSQRKSRFIEPIDNSTEDYTDIPRTIKLSIEYLYEKALKVPGLFRESANALELQRLKALMESDQDVNLTTYTEPHNVGGLLKLYLRERPSPLFPYELHKKIISLYELNPIINEEFCKNVRELMLMELSKGQFLILRYLFELLHAVHLNAEHNNMNSYNLAVCFAPSLIHSFDCSCIEIVNRLVEDYELVFGVEVAKDKESSPSSPSPSSYRKSRIISSSPKLAGKTRLSGAINKRQSISPSSLSPTINSSNDHQPNNNNNNIEQIQLDGASSSPNRLSPTNSRSPRLSSSPNRLSQSPKLPPRNYNGDNLSPPTSRSPRLSSTSPNRLSQPPPPPPSSIVNNQGQVKSTVVQQLIDQELDDDSHGGTNGTEEEEELLISSSNKSNGSNSTSILKRLSMHHQSSTTLDTDNTSTSEDYDEFEDDDQQSNNNQQSINNNQSNQQQQQQPSVKNIVSSINVNHPNSVSIIPTYKSSIPKPIVSTQYHNIKNFNTPSNHNNNVIYSNNSNNGGFKSKKVSPSTSTSMMKRPTLNIASRSTTSPQISFHKPTSTTTTTTSSIKQSHSFKHGSSKDGVVSSNHDSVANLKSIWESKEKEKEIKKVI